MPSRNGSGQLALSQMLWNNHLLSDLELSNDQYHTTYESKQISIIQCKLSLVDITWIRSITPLVHDRPDVLSTGSAGIESALLAITILLAVIAALATVRKVIPGSRSRSGRRILNACMVTICAVNLVTDAALDDAAMVTVRVLLAVHTAGISALTVFLGVLEEIDYNVVRSIV